MSLVIATGDDLIEDGDDQEPDAIRVHIVGSDIEKIEGTEYASFQTYTLLGTETQPVQLLAQDLKRKRAVIIVNNGFLDNNSAGYVKIGDIGSVSNNQGALLASGNSVVLESGRAIYLMTDGTNSLTVTVIDERYK